jgi:mono/diheme cytochrome c family protein
VLIDQGWSPEQKATWYTLSQGSRLLPLDWLRALEQPGSAAPFLDRDHIEKFRYLPGASPGQGDLPVGFAIDDQRDRRFSRITKLRWKKPQSEQEQWVGMNCAACHTAELTFKGKRLRVEGGPTLADFQNFMRTLVRALVATRDDAGKFSRFAAAVLKDANTPSNQGLLRTALANLIDWQLKVETANETPLEYGFARLDAFGHIFNKVLLRLEAPGQQYRNPSDAPVSYPFLWNTRQQDKVQWNGIAPNTMLGPLEIGALGRNVGEVTGVFADLTLLRFGPAIDGYVTSAHVKNLVKLEKQLASLKPPAWPDAFPAIDAAKWEAGKDLFATPSAGCLSCHQTLQRDDLTTRVAVQMTRLSGARAIGTDPWMACNAYTYQAKSGLLWGTPSKFIVFSSPPLGETAPLADLLGTAVVGSIFYKKADLVGDVRQALKSTNLFKLTREADPGAAGVLAALAQPAPNADKAARLERCMSEASPLLAYKGRPLAGVWATPPFLHNGSVPTLYDLLLPPDQRPQVFAVGTREFDPEKVGYVTDRTSDNSFTFRTRDDAGAMIPGNSNTGHNYGNTSLTEEQRWALVEYLKAVGGRRDGNRIVS